MIIWIFLARRFQIMKNIKDYFSNRRARLAVQKMDKDQLYNLFNFGLRFSMVISFLAGFMFCLLLLRIQSLPFSPAFF